MSHIWMSHVAIYCLLLLWDMIDISHQMCAITHTDVCHHMCDWYTTFHVNTLQHTLIYHLSRQHTATHIDCNTHWYTTSNDRNTILEQHTTTHYNDWYTTSNDRNTISYTAKHLSNTLQHTTTQYNTLQHTTTHCNTLEQTRTHCNHIPRQRTSNQETQNTDIIQCCNLNPKP